jgi:4-hydroxyphenylpyruvate dioxygenase
MADLFENPMGLMGFEFVEFASPTPNLLEPLFEKLGFSLVARHRSKDVVLYRQGDINFIVNREPKSLAGYFAAEHGPSACALAFRVRDSHKAYARALDLGAQPIEVPTGPMELRLPAIKGIGGAPLYLIDRFEDGKSIYDIDFEWLPGAERHPRGHGLRVIDHMTHNVYRGRMAYWAGFYEKLFNFRQIRYFDIKGEYTGLTSKAMTAPDGLIRIPLNEEASKTTGQIEEFLMAFNGEGIQHIALLTDDITASLDSLQMAGVPMMTAPNDVYYEMLDERLPGHGQDVPALKARGILVDGSTTDDGPPLGGEPPRGAERGREPVPAHGRTPREAAGPASPAVDGAAGDSGAKSSGKKRLLLQIFSQTVLGPVFFEFIQRKGDEGFGEGNFKALFESMERDQLRRGVIQADD